MDLSIAALSAVRQLDTSSERGTLLLREVRGFQVPRNKDWVNLVAQAGGVGRNLNLFA